jgi:hypothetical protein
VLQPQDVAWPKAQEARQLRDVAAALETELPRDLQPETARSEPGLGASAEHSACPLQAEVGEVEQTSEAEALAQRISRRWFRRNPQSSRSERLSNFAPWGKMPDHHDAAVYVSTGAKISAPSSIPFARRISAA